jgi:ABC-type oligopeptide transport system substrate-binding subunit
MKKLIILLTLSLVLIGFTGGCTKTEITEDGISVGGNFIEGVSGGDAETLNWILAADASSFGYVGHTLDSLATYDNEFNIQLRCLAKDIEVSP